MKKAECLHDRVVIKPIEKQIESSSGLSIPENDQKQDPIGEVIAVGIGVPLHNIKLNITSETNQEAMSLLKEIVQMIERGREMRVKVGDIVQYGGMAGTNVNVPEDLANIPAGKYVIIREADIFWKLTE